MQYTDLQQYQQQQQAIKDLQKYHDPEHLWECILAFEYSRAMKSHFRKFGNQMSGSGNHLCNYASLLA